MPKRIMSLTDMKVLKAKSNGKQFTLFDGNGLFLLVTPSGGKLWRFKYRFGGKEKLLAFGAYPVISLQDARQKREEARRQLANGIDPGSVRKAQKQAKTESTETFEVIAREWHGRFTQTWTAGHADTIMSRLERDLFPWLGKRPIVEIKATDVLSILRRVESRGALESAHRIRTICGQVFRYAVATGRAERDPSADLKGALSEFVNNKQIISDVPLEKTLQRPLLSCFDQFIDQAVATGKTGPKIILTGLNSQSGGHMGLACAATSKKNDVSVLPNITASRKIPRNTNVQFRYSRQIKGLHGFQKRELRFSDSAIETVFCSGLKLGGGQIYEKIIISASSLIVPPRV